MEIGGPFGYGDPPEDFPGQGLGGPGFGGSTFDDADAPQRGWLPPEDRLWRHPSELRAGATGTERAARRSRPVNRWVAATVGVMGAAAVASVAVAVTRPPATGGHMVATDTSLVTLPAVSSAGVHSGQVSIGPDVVQMVDAMRASLVTLVPQGSSSPVARVTGVVLPGGTLVATAAAPVGGVAGFDVITADGRHHSGQLAGTDERSGIAVVRLQDHLAAASFADEPVRARQLAVAACICRVSSSTSRAGDGPDVAIGMVQQVGTAATLDGGPSLVDAIEAEMPFGVSSWGSVLLDDQGQVIGILDGERDTGDDVLGYFVPAPLAVSVAEELAGSHHVGRGWLGIVCSDAPAGGAQVTTVLPGSPAADAGLQPGDVVEAVDAHAVASLADLQARLYTTQPGSRLLLTVVRGGAVRTTPVVVRTNPS